MKTNTETVVSITKVEHSIEKAVKKAIHLAGGMETVVSKGDRVYLKPNFVAPRDSSKGVTTNFEVIRVVAEEVRRCGGIPIIFETPAIEFDQKTVYDYLGVFDFAQQNGIHLTNSSVDLIRVPVPGGNVFKSLKIPQILHKAKIINLPKLKTHVSAKMTCGMKNLIGLLPDSEKRKVHIGDVHESISDIFKVLRPVLTVVDATTCMEGDGPTYGDKVDLGLIISGKDTLATDKVCSQIIGLPWEEVKYIRLANSKSNMTKVNVVGESITDIQSHFHIPQKSSVFHLCFSLIYIFDVLFSKIFGKPLNQFLYSTGHVGTNPKLIKDKCNGCGDCVEVCPVEGVLKIDTYEIDYKKCIRCLDCYFVCSQQAIKVKGVSRPTES
ncbi:MAG: DUF362 domain-containing protein [Calditrichae bacterium]|nr:DUF362 domain-containing protein [Calditrichia bacterium]